jgi:hypothetical protein
VDLGGVSGFEAVGWRVESGGWGVGGEGCSTPALRRISTRMLSPMQTSASPSGTTNPGPERYLR